jgi:hypothetical protein
MAERRAEQIKELSSTLQKLRILRRARDRDDGKPQRLAGLHVEEARVPD